MSILSIAGFDPSSGAGITMDIKAATKLNCHLVSAPSCLTVQNSKEFDSINAAPINVLVKQVEVILRDIDVKIVKIGLLANEEIALGVHKLLKTKLPKAKIIIDPVIVSTTGRKILDENCIKALRDVLLLNSYLTTPNIIEASILSEINIDSFKDVQNAAKILQDLGVKNVLIKGGHLNEDMGEIQHLLLKENGEEIIIKNKRIKTDVEIRGTGCMLSTAISCFLSQDYNIEEAIQKADDFVNQEIQKARMIGSKLIMI
jgi:hydroxymethylpyrimidine/phosphomethylpyrimidine kinase